MADIISVDPARRAGRELGAGEPGSAAGDGADVRAGAEGAEADALCGAPYGQVSGERVKYRNGYRDRRWDTRAGTIDLAILCRPNTRSSA
jgi:hypothetical protein